MEGGREEFGREQAQCELPAAIDNDQADKAKMCKLKVSKFTEVISNVYGLTYLLSQSLQDQTEEGNGERLGGRADSFSEFLDSNQSGFAVGRGRAIFNFLSQLLGFSSARLPVGRGGGSQTHNSMNKRQK